MKALTPRWQEADEAVESLVSTLVAAAVPTSDRNGRKRPHGRTHTKRPKSTFRQIADVIRDHRLAPGLHVSRDMVAALLIGHRDLVTNPVLVVAVAQACSIISGRKLSAKKAARMRVASIRVAQLIAHAEADPHPIPEPRVETAPMMIAPSPSPSPSAEHAPLDGAPLEVAVPAAAPVEIAAAADAVPVEVEAEVAAQPRVGLAPPDAAPVVVDRRRLWWLAAAVALLLLLIVAVLLAVG
jgi:hypothetical protein